jgi:mycofactocin system transcriptional regulator
MALDAKWKGSPVGVGARVWLMSSEVGSRASSTGRPPATSRAQLEHVGLRLFREHGYEATTVERIADEAGISRRTFFRYFESKNDLSWGDFHSRLDWLRDRLNSVPAQQPVADAIADAVIEFNVVPPDEQIWHRQRMRLLLHVPALQAHGTLRYADWRAVIAEFVAARRGEPVDSLIPRTVGYLALGAALAAYEQWLANDGGDLRQLMAESFELFRGCLPGRPSSLERVRGASRG